VLGVNGQTINPYRGVVAAQFYGLRRPIMAGLAEGNQFAKDELVPVATVGDLVVGDGGGSDLTALEAPRAQRMNLQLVAGSPSPAFQRIPSDVWRNVVLHRICIFWAAFAEGARQGREQARISTLAQSGDPSSRRAASRN
jgi:hypothetical protein